MSAAPQPIGWDRLIRIGHWTMASLFLANYWLLEGGDASHEWVGYGLFGVLLARLLHGFTGPENARFRNFWPTPARVRYCLQHFDDVQQQHRHGSHHNAIAGLMVIFLLLVMGITAVSGWMQELDAFWGEDWVQNLHEWSADAVMLAVLVHVSAVFWLQWRYRLALVRGML